MVHRVSKSQGGGQKFPMDCLSRRPGRGFYPNKIGPKLAQIGRSIQLAQKLIFVRLRLTCQVQQSFITGYVKEQSTNQIRQGLMNVSTNRNTEISYEKDQNIRASIPSAKQQLLCPRINPRFTGFSKMGGIPPPRKSPKFFPFRAVFGNLSKF